MLTLRLMLRPARGGVHLAPVTVAREARHCPEVAQRDDPQRVARGQPRARLSCRPQAVDVAWHALLFFPADYAVLCGALLQVPAPRPPP